MDNRLLSCWRMMMLARACGVSHSALALLLALLDKWNALHRPSGFTMTNKELMERAGFGSHVSLDKAKAELVKAGLIKNEASKKRFGSKYTVLFGALSV